jgi:hypothetical protein
MESDLNALLNTSNEAKPLEFQSQFNDLLNQRVAAAIERQKQEMAQTLFVPVEELPDDIELSDTDNTDESESEDGINNDETYLADIDTEENNNGQDS